MKPHKPSGNLIWLKVQLPKELHKRLAKAAIDREENLPETVIVLLTRALKL